MFSSSGAAGASSVGKIGTIGRPDEVGTTTDGPSSAKNEKLPKIMLLTQGNFENENTVDKIDLVKHILPETCFGWKIQTEILCLPHSLA